MNKRETKEFEVQQIAQLLENPAYKAAVNGLANEIIAELGTMPLDGSEAQQNKVLERVRELQIVNRLDSRLKGQVKRAMRREEQNENAANNGGSSN